MTGGTIRKPMQKAATKRGVQITAAGIAAGALLLAGILVCVSPDVPDDWPLAAFPVFLESALAHTLDAVTVTPVSNISDEGTRELEGATSTDTIGFLRTESIYAFVASVDDDGVQAINLSNMSNPVVAGSIGNDGTNELDGAYGIKIFIHGNNLYAAVTASEDDGVQILDVTSPSNIATAGKVSDDPNKELDGARGIDVIEIDGRNYAIVAGHEDNGVEILNLTDPTANPLPSSDSISDNSTLALAGAIDAKFFKLEGDDKTYAVVAASTDNGIQILNVTDPANVMAVNSTSDSPDLLLSQAYDVDVFEHNTRTYAIVAARSDHGVQLLDLTGLPDIVPAGSISASNNDGSSTVILNVTISVTAFDWSGKQYAAVGTETSGMQILDIRDPRNPAAAGGVDAGTVTNAKVSNMTDVDVVGHQSIVIATVDDGVQILELEENPTTNSLPVVVMMNQTADGGDTVTLNATVTDTDDPTPIYDWSYEITHANPLRIEIANETSLETTFVAPHVRNGATAVFKLRVTDHHGGTTTGTMQVTINPNQPPTVSAGPDQTVDEGQPVTLTGSATDPNPSDDQLTYLWTNNSTLNIILDDDAAASTTFTAPQVTANTTIRFTLTATDEHGAAASDTVDITIRDVEPPSDFVTTWETEAANQTITINVGNSINSYDIDWGDGTGQTGVTGNKTHTYASAGRYAVTIGGEFDRFNLGATGRDNGARLASIDQWGSARWTSMKDAFRGAPNMVYNAADAPDLSGVTDMSGMFAGAVRFNGNLSAWNVSQVTDMSGMFAGSRLASTATSPPGTSRRSPTCPACSAAAPSTATSPPGTSRRSPTCPACSAIPSSTATSPPGTSRRSPTCPACSSAPPPSTATFPPGTSRRSPTCPACSSAPHHSTRTSAGGT